MDSAKLNGNPLPTPAADPTYYVLVTWIHPSGQGGQIALDSYTPVLHGRPSMFGPPHTAHCVQAVKEMLAKGGMVGAEAFVSYIYRYEVVPSAIIDLRGGTKN